MAQSHHYQLEVIGELIDSIFVGSLDLGDQEFLFGGSMRALGVIPTDSVNIAPFLPFDAGPLGTTPLSEAVFEESIEAPHRIPDIGFEIEDY